MLAFRPWWRVVSLLGVLALLPLAWRGVEREAPILIQQVASETRSVPPAVAELTPRPSAPASRPGLLAAEAAGETGPSDPSIQPAASHEAPTTFSAASPDTLGAAPSRDAATPCPEEEPSREAGQARVNLNTADAELLQTLPGIGPALARRIIEHRERWGPFTDPRQLLEVSGIGEKRLEQLLPWVTVE